MSEEQILLCKSYTDYEISVKRIFGCLEIALGLTFIICGFIEFAIKILKRWVRK